MASIYGTRLYFSGVESRRLLDTFLQFRVPHIQVSFYYLRKVFGGDTNAWEEYASQFSSVLIDHGLIYHKYKSEPEKQEFLEDYYNFVAKLNPKFYSAVVTHNEISLDRVLDEQKLLYPLDDLLELFDGDTQSIFQNIEYVGISNKIANQEDRMSQLCSQAERTGSRIHLFGVASQRVLKKWPIYSANTSSWRTGSRYANTYIYEGLGKGLKLFQPTDKSNLEKTNKEKKQVRQRLKVRVEQKQQHLYAEIDWPKLIEEDDSWEVDKANLTQWMLYQKDLELEHKKAYWLDSNEKQLLNLRKAEYYGASNSSEVPTKRDDTTVAYPRKNDADATALSDSLEKQAHEEKGNALLPPSIEGEILERFTSTEDFKNTIGVSNTKNTTKTPANQRISRVDDRMFAPRMCDNCILANRCPKYESGASCAYGLSDSYSPALIDEHINEDVADLFAMQKDRILQGYMEEKADASGLSKDLTNNIRLYLEMLALHSEATDKRDSLKIEAKGTGLMQMFGKRS